MIHRMDPPADPDREPMPERIVPMMARRVDDAPADQRNWSFEVKWDGVRAIAYVQPGRLRLESRNLNEVTDAYPEIRGLSRRSGCTRRCSTGRSSPSTTPAGRASSASSAGCT